MTNNNDTQTAHAVWLDARYKALPPIRLAIVQDEDEDEVWIDQTFKDAALAVRGEYAPPAPKRGPGRPRKTV